MKTDKITSYEGRTQRTRMLLGEDALTLLKRTHVAVFGIGGVGGFAVEALARAGIGEFTLIDHDTVAESNINRQIVATTRTIGCYKTEVMKQRILDINPEAVVHLYECFYLPGESEDMMPLSRYDYVVDAIDTVTAKLALAMEADRVQVPIISCMGTGNKLHPEMLEIADIYKTSECPLAKVMRRELKNRHIKKLKVIYSRERPIRPEPQILEKGRRITPGSVSFVPSVAGLLIAGEVIRDLSIQTND